MYNSLECYVVNDVLHRILRNSGDEDLKNQIFVAAPYADQTAMLLAIMRGGRMFLNERVGAGRDLNVAVENIDALQGSEREVAVISLTRSNKARNVGFLTDDGRLNVAFTRPRKLLVIVGDFSTMTTSRVAASIYEQVAGRSERTRLEFHRPRSRRDIDTFQETQMHRINSNRSV